MLIKVFYFKDSIIIGLAFSFASMFFEEKTFTESIIGTVFEGDVSSAVAMMNKAIDAIISFMPEPIDIIAKIIFNVNALTGLVFSSLVIFTYSIMEITFGGTDEIFLWKKIFRK